VSDRIQQIKERWASIPPLMHGVMERGLGRQTHKVCTLDGFPVEETLEFVDAQASAPEDIAHLLERLGEAEKLLIEAGKLSVMAEEEHNASGDDTDCDVCNWLFDVAAFLNREGR
jgi:hypothetical protein